MFESRKPVYTVQVWEYSMAIVRTRNDHTQD
jgi:hypothetical protein